MHFFFFCECLCVKLLTQNLKLAVLAAFTPQISQSHLILGQTYGPPSIYSEFTLGLHDAPYSPAAPPKTPNHSFLIC